MKTHKEIIETIFDEEEWNAITLTRNTVPGNFTKVEPFPDHMCSMGTTEGFFWPKTKAEAEGFFLISLGKSHKLAIKIIGKDNNLRFTLTDGHGIDCFVYEQVARLIICNIIKEALATDRESKRKTIL